MASNSVKKRAEMRRHELLNRGTSRLKQITGDALVSTFPGEVAGHQEHADALIDALPPPPTVAVSKEVRTRGTEASAVKWSAYDTLPAIDSLQHSQPRPSTGQYLVHSVAISSLLRILLAAACATMCSLSWDIQSTAPQPVAGYQHSASIQRSWTLLQRSPGAAEAARLAGFLAESVISKYAVFLHKSSAMRALLASPVLALVALLEAGIIAAACMTCHHTARKGWEPQATPLRKMLLMLAPRLANKLGILSVLHACIATITDNAATFIMALVLYQTLPAVLRI